MQSGSSGSPVHRRRSPPSHRELRGKKVAGRSAVRSASYRLWSCARCREQQRLCRPCDRGQRLCTPCAPEQRRQAVRRAGARYQGTRRGRRLHAARQARYRERRANFAAPKVTHPSVTQAAAAPTASVQPEVVSGGKDRDERAKTDRHRCSRCGVALPPWARVERRRGRPLGRRAPRPPRGPP